MGDVVLFSFASALNPTLLAATTVMLFMPSHPERLMLGYWLGAMVTSLASGLLLIYVLDGTGASNNAKHTLTPIEDYVLAGGALIVAALLAGGAFRRVRTRRAMRRTEPRKTPKWQQRMRDGELRTAFVIGMALSLPGATYLLLLDRLSKLHYSFVVTLLVLIGSNLIQLIVLEVPMLSFSIWPERTPRAIEAVKAWIGTHGREYGAVGLTVIGVLLVVRGITGAW